MNRLSSYTEFSGIFTYLSETEKPNIEFLVSKLTDSPFLQELTEFSETFLSIHDISHELNVAVLIKSKEKEVIYSCAPYLTCLKIVIFQSSENFFVGYPKVSHRSYVDIIHNQKPQNAKKKFKNLEKLLSRILTQTKFKKNLNLFQEKASDEPEKSTLPELQILKSPSSGVILNKIIEPDSKVLQTSSSIAPSLELKIESESHNKVLQKSINETPDLVPNNESESSYPDFTIPNLSDQGLFDPANNFRVRLCKVELKSLNKLKLSDPIPSSLEKTEVTEIVLNIPCTNYKQQPIANIEKPIDISQIAKEVIISIIENSHIISDYELEFNFK